MDIYNVTNFISIKQNKIAIRTQHTIYKHVNDYYFCCHKSNFSPAIPHEIRKVASKFRSKPEVIFLYFKGLDGLKMCKGNFKHT